MGDTSQRLGLFLVVLGTLLVLGIWMRLSALWGFAWLGLVCVSLYLFTHRYFLLVIGATVAGLSLATLYGQRYTADSAGFGIIIALGFAAIFVLDRAHRRWRWQWWPLVLAGIFGVGSVLQVFDASLSQGPLGRWSPYGIVLAGLYLVLRHRQSAEGRRQRPAPEAPRAEPAVSDNLRS